MKQANNGTMEIMYGELNFAIEEIVVSCGEARADYIHNKTESNYLRYKRKKIKTKILLDMMLMPCKYMDVNYIDYLSDIFKIGETSFNNRMVILNQEG